MTSPGELEKPHANLALVQVKRKKDRVVKIWETKKKEKTKKGLCLCESGRPHERRALTSV